MDRSRVRLFSDLILPRWQSAAFLNPPDWGASHEYRQGCGRQRRNGQSDPTYETIGIMPLPVRRDSNYGDYSIEKVHRLGFVRRARNLGFSMVQIRDLLRLWDDEGRSTRDVKALTLAMSTNSTARCSKASMAERNGPQSVGAGSRTTLGRAGRRPNRTTGNECGSRLFLDVSGAAERGDLSVPGARDE